MHGRGNGCSGQHGAGGWLAVLARGSAPTDGRHSTMALCGAVTSDPLQGAFGKPTLRCPSACRKDPARRACCSPCAGATAARTAPAGHATHQRAMLLTTGPCYSPRPLYSARPASHPRLFICRFRTPHPHLGPPHFPLVLLQLVFTPGPPHAPFRPRRPPPHRSTRLTRGSAPPRRSRSTSTRRRRSCGRCSLWPTPFPGTGRRSSGGRAGRGGEQREWGAGRRSSKDGVYYHMALRVAHPSNVHVKFFRVRVASGSYPAERRAAVWPGCTLGWFRPSYPHMRLTTCAAPPATLSPWRAGL